MTQARKKPVVVDVFQMTLERMVDQTDWPQWLKSAWALHPSMSGSLRYDMTAQRQMLIHTMKGDMVVVPGSWIIKGVKGELYPCDNEIFHQTYEVLE